MTKELDSLHAALKSDGWKFSKPPTNTGVDWYAWKRLPDAKDCNCNEKPPSLIINPQATYFRGETHCSAEFEIAGELPSGRWINFKVYSIGIDEVMQVIPECTEVLKTAWNAAAELAVNHTTKNATATPASTTGHMNQKELCAPSNQANHPDQLS